MIYREKNLESGFSIPLLLLPPPGPPDEEASYGLSAQTITENSPLSDFQKGSSYLLAMKRAPESCDRDLAV
jgi:hypothetical protein